MLRGDFPALDAVAAVQVVGDHTLACLLVHEGNDVGAGTNGQDVRIADFCVEPIDHFPYHGAINQQIEATIEDHQGEPG